MGSMPPGSGSPAVNPAMQPFAGGAPPGTAPQPSQQQQQLILNKMQQCMANMQKLQQMLNTGAPCCPSCNPRANSNPPAYGLWAGLLRWLGLHD